MDVREVHSEDGRWRDVAQDCDQHFVFEPVTPHSVSANQWLKPMF